MSTLDFDTMIAEVHSGVADMMAGSERIRKALVALRDGDTWRDGFDTFESFAEATLGLPSEYVESCLRRHLPAMPNTQH